MCPDREGGGGQDSVSGVLVGNAAVKSVGDVQGHVQWQWSSIPWVQLILHDSGKRCTFGARPEDGM